MRSRTSRGVSKWSRGKELYIGSVVSAIGKVSGSPGIVPGPPEGSRGSIGWGHLSRRAPWAEVGGEPAPGGLVRPPCPPLRLRLGTLGEGAPPLALGGKAPPWPPPPLGTLYKEGEGGQPHHSPWRLPLPPVTPLTLAELGEALPRSPLLPPPRRRAAGVGNRSIILKFSYAHQDASMEYTSKEGKGVHLHTLVDRERKRSSERG